MKQGPGPGKMTLLQRFITSVAEVAVDCDIVTLKRRLKSGEGGGGDQIVSFLIISTSVWKNVIRIKVPLNIALRRMLHIVRNIIHV